MMNRVTGRVRVLLSVLTLIWLALATTTALAQSSDPLSLRLASFSSQPGPARLTDVSGSLDLFVPVSALSSIRGASLDLRYTHSIALLQERSYLLVRLNDISIAQIPFDVAQPVAAARVGLPDDLWKPGFNKLTLTVIQHYTDRCEDGLAPELWTEIDLHRSRLSLRAEPIQQALTLRDLGEAFGPGVDAISEINLVAATSALASPVGARAMPMVAQALALRRDFQPLHVRSVLFDAGEDLAATLTQAPHVLIGTVEELAGLLAPPETAVTGPQLFIRRLISEPDSLDPDSQTRPAVLQLVVTGRTPEEVVEAAATLALMDDKLNPVDSVTVLGRTQWPAAAAPLARRVLGAQTRYQFADLGLKTHDMRGFGGHGAGLDVLLPGDFYTHDSAQIEFLLDFGYGAGMGPGSVMNVFLNGEFVHGRLLGEPDGEQFSGYRIVLPARRFLPGLNRVNFEFTLRPEVVVGECAGLDGRHLVAQIRGTSSIALPAFGQASSQPNLRLFAGTGYPFSSAHAAQQFDLQVAERGQIGAALTLLGRIAQTAAAAHEGWTLRVGLDSAPASGRGVVLAALDELSPAVSDAWSLSLGRSMRWPHSSMNDLRRATDEAQPGLAQRLTALLGIQPAPSPDRPPVGGMRGTITQTGGLGTFAGLSLQLDPRADAHAPMLLLTAESTAILQQRVENLIAPEIWSQLDGDFMLWSQDQDSVLVARVADSFVIGEEDHWLLLRLWLSTQPWYWLALVLVAALLVVLLSVRLLRARRARFEPAE